MRLPVSAARLALAEAQPARISRKCSVPQVGPLLHRARVATAVSLAQVERTAA
jgi:hypothetical protein